MRVIPVLLAFLGLAISSAASADCCRLVKIDAETPPILVRACEPTAETTCGEVVFSGVLALGDAQEVCVEGQSIVYEQSEEMDGSFGPPLVAVCTGGDVEL